MEKTKEKEYSQSLSPASSSVLTCPFSDYTAIFLIRFIDF